jgi:hypothetical protein
MFRHEIFKDPIFTPGRDMCLCSVTAVRSSVASGYGQVSRIANLSRVDLVFEITY